MAEIGLKEGNCLKAMESVEKYLDTKYGIVLLQPPYHRYHVELGEISSYPPGYKENAGIFCHNNPWISIAETVVGRGNRAWQVYTRTCPAYIEDISEIHRTEPYVYSQMIAGKDAPNLIWRKRKLPKQPDRLHSRKRHQPQHRHLPLLQHRQMILNLSQLLQLQSLQVPELLPVIS